MSSPPNKPTARPLAEVIQVDDDGGFYLSGSRCSECHEVLVTTHRACPKCSAEGTLERIRLAERGQLYSYTIVHRSFPGVKTPIISAVIELDGGGFLRGNLEGVSPDPEMIRFDIPLKVAFDVLSSSDGSGSQLVRYIFVPDQEKVSSSE